MITPSFEDFVELSKRGNIIPVFKAVTADLLTPVLAYLKIESDVPYAFLLESVEGGEKIARYSFLGCNPYLIIRAKGDVVEIIRGAEPIKRKGRLLEVMRKITERYKSVKVPGLPPFAGGAVGYFAYDTVRWVEDIPQEGEDDLQLDDSVMMFFSSLLAFDHVRQQILIISNCILDEQATHLDSKYQKALAEIQSLEEMLNRPARIPQFGVSSADTIKIKSNFSKSDYLKAVEKGKEYIKSGDIFQVVLSQRFSASVTSAPFNIYRALRIVNPSPYMFYLKLKDFSVIGSSPEMLVKIVDGIAYYRPIAGTRPRGTGDDEDALLAEELKADDKEKAEHIMLVDLGRNDLGKVCEFGSVEVVDLMLVEKYSHVMHLVSGLRGRLRQEVDRFDALMACFPAGTVTGAPKVRAMEIIDELEPNKRGVYAGAILYLDFSGTLDSCIAIRTLVVKDGTAYIQAGGGIVADSIPEKEFQETINKSRALVKAVELAETGF
ncbi:MAG: anthranilate synthase component I [Acidobacteria bacterium]|nr:MAG: anthranilate synthase component I [Acidobacteriota bacterium]